LATPTPNPTPSHDTAPAVIDNQQITQALIEFDEALVARFGTSPELVRMLAEAHLQLGAAMLTGLGVSDLQALTLMRDARKAIKAGG
jgi:hypothetical protein